jgi:predicted nucleic acid-binding protein
MPESAIVINTGPILALIAATGDLSLLPKLYSRVIVPREVCD